MPDPEPLQKLRDRLETLIQGPGWDEHPNKVNESGLSLVIHERTGLEFILVPGGVFEMGTDEDFSSKPLLRVTVPTFLECEKPTHLVSVAPFLMCASPCTQKAWDLVGGADERNFQGARLPVEGVSWDDVQDWLTRAGDGLRLPSEAEWEYCCRAGTSTSFSFGDDESRLADHGWFASNSDEKLHAVREKLANPWGFHDFYGNVWEWCEDHWHDTYHGAPIDGRAWVGGAPANRVIRSGCDFVTANPRGSAYRNYAGKDWRSLSIGFRPAVSLSL